MERKEGKTSKQMYEKTKNTREEMNMLSKHRYRIFLYELSITNLCTLSIAENARSLTLFVAEMMN
jgi:hypothetical protein